MASNGGAIPAGYPVQTSTNLTKAKVRQGSSSASFNIRLPRWSGIAELNTKSTGRPVFLTPVKQQPKHITYEARATITHTKLNYPFTMRDLFRERKPKNVSDLVRLMQKHMNNTGACFSSVVEMPRLSLELDPESNSEYLTMTIPPNMAFYTSYAEFWFHLGFRKMDITDTMEVIGGRNTRTITTRVFGFYNADQEEKIFVSRKTLFASTLMNTLTNFSKTVPDPIQFQVHVGEYDNELVRVYSPTGATPLTAATRDMVLGIEGLLEDIRYRLNYAANLIEVSVNRNDPERIYLSNRVVSDVEPEQVELGAQQPEPPRDFSTKLHIQFGPELSQALGVAATQLFAFDLEVPRTYSFKLKGGGGDQNSDPFSGLYPLTMISQSLGQAHSYVEGLGYVPLMAVIHDQTRPIYSKGFEFETDGINLTIEFYDRAMQKIIFQEDMELILLIEFQRFCFCEQVWK
jgi:hypothetical protein